ncbi:unnamed protein product [Adineta steineri]|uniref:Uncharacterized protein n=1 Tax=Adineta steineri TaxID=433720 RepID=A0A814KLU8_9BILA|nr:unnamed protein product [Adineta steineri]
MKHCLTSGALELPSVAPQTQNGITSMITIRVSKPVHLGKRKRSASLPPRRSSSKEYVVLQDIFVFYSTKFCQFL